SFPTAASAPGCAGWKFRINTTRWEECAPILRPTDLRAETGVSTNYEPKHAENISGVGQDGQPRQSGFLAHGGKARRSLGGSQPGAGIRRRNARNLFRQSPDPVRAGDVRGRGSELRQGA